MAVEKAVPDNLARAFAQIHEIEKGLLSGSLDPAQARKPLQRIIERDFDGAETALLSTRIVKYPVNYRSSLATAIEAGDFSSKNDYYDELKRKDWTSPDGTKDHLPTDKKVEIEATVVSPGRVVDTLEIETEIGRIGFRPANWIESLAYAQAHEGPFGDPIVGLGSICVDRIGDREVVIFQSGSADDTRRLGFACYDVRWGPSDRFLAVRT